MVLLVHPGGPFFARKDAGVWSIAKGELNENEDPFVAAKREFAEETGMSIDGNFTRLQPVKQKGGKIVEAWAVEASLDISAFKSSTFPLEWPPKSGIIRAYPEVDKIQWFTIPEAREKINTAQADFLDQLFLLVAG